MRHKLSNKGNYEVQITFNVIVKKNNQSSISNADREIPTLGSTDNTGNSVNIVSGIIRLPSVWDFSFASVTNDTLIVTTINLRQMREYITVSSINAF